MQNVLEGQNRFLTEKEREREKDKRTQKKEENVLEIFSQDLVCKLNLIQHEIQFKCTMTSIYLMQSETTTMIF